MTSHLVCIFHWVKYSSRQYRHCVGNSPTAFSAARLRTQRSQLISHLQFGQLLWVLIPFSFDDHIFDAFDWSKPCLDISSFSLASAIRWLRQVAHMRWPFLHCHKLTLGISRHTVQEQWRLILSRISFGDSAVGIFRPEEDDDSSSVFISFFIFEGGGSKCSFIGSSRKYLLGTTSHCLQKLRSYNL